MISKPVLVVSWTGCREDARCRDADRVLSIVGELAGVQLVWRNRVLGGGHEFMHEHEHEKYAYLLGLCHNDCAIVGCRGKLD